MLRLNIRSGLLIALLASALIGIEIVLTDTDLWEAVPSHAYGLIGFVIVDFIIAGLLFVKRGVAFRFAMFWSIIQFALMLGDIATAQASGFNSYVEFMNYLFSLWNFDLLLILQPIIALLGFKGYRQMVIKQDTARTS